VTVQSILLIFAHLWVIQIMAKQIGITTTQHVPIQYELAELRTRFGAALMDAFVVFLFFVIQLLIGVQVVGQNIFSQYLPVLAPWYIGTYLLYQMLSGAWGHGQTLGKRLVHIKVVRLDGKEPTWSDYVLRELMLIVDVVGSFSLIGIVLIKSTPFSQRLGDMAAHTTVIHLHSSGSKFSLKEILNISTREHYEPVYPQVTRLTEADMILIKNALNRMQEHNNDGHRQAIFTLAQRACTVLQIDPMPADRVLLLRTLLRDYIVLTR
jgi:uncharacterized RDD family membrane protein YckC